MQKLTRKLGQPLSVRVFNTLFQVSNPTHCLQINMLPPSLIPEDSVRMLSSSSLLLSVTDAAQRFSKGRVSEYYPLRINQMLELSSCDMASSRCEFVNANKAVIISPKQTEAGKVSILVFDRELVETQKKKQFSTSILQLRQLQTLIKSGLEHYTHLRMAQLHHSSNLFTL